MKRFFIFLGVMSFITLGTYLSTLIKTPRELEQVMELCGVEWPVGTLYETDVDDNIILTITQKLVAFKGLWPKGTKFYFEGPEVFGVEVFDQFEFAGFDFFKGAKIAFKTKKNMPVHVLELSGEKVLDGVEVKEGCLVKFVNYIMTSVSCPEFEEVYFKRHLSLPEASLEEEKSL